MLPSKEQEKNYEFFKNQLSALLSDPLKEGKYVVIYGEAVKGIYDTVDAAYRAAYLKFEKDFIIQQVMDESKINNYLSPAVIV